MKDKLIFILAIVLVITSVYNSYVNWQNEKKVDEMYDFQLKEKEAEKIKYAKTVDSLQIAIEIKESDINYLQQKLKQNIRKAKINNRKYEKRKEIAKRIDDVDSLASILSRRYIKKR